MAITTTAPTGLDRAASTRRGTSPWVRTVLSATFMLLMLAAAHLSMMVVGAIERRIDAPQPAAGIEARMFTDSPLAVELQTDLAIADAETMGQDTLLALQSGLAHLSDLLTEAYFR